MSQKLIDIELLKSYPFASEDVKRFLEHAYGREVFNVFTENDQWSLIAAIAKSMRIDGDKEVVYPFNFKGEELTLRITLTVATEEEKKEPIDYPRWTKIFDTFRGIKKTIDGNKT